MSGLCGWFDAHSKPPWTEAALQAMVRAISRFDTAHARLASCSAGGIAAAACDGGLDVHCEGTRMAAVWGHVSASQMEPALSGQGIARALLDAYMQRGAHFMHAVSGEFVLAICDGTRGEAFLAVDRMATRPMYYRTIGGTLVFGTRLDALGPCFHDAPDIRAQAVHDYVHFHMVPSPQTIYAGCSRLLPGTLLKWRNGVSSIATYWRMDYIEDRRASLQPLKREFTALLRDSVREAAKVGTVGSFLSGGTDSSTIAGMLRDVTGERPRTYSIGFDAKGYDEMAYARIAARHFGTRHHEYYVTADDVVSAVPKIAAVHDQPFGNSSAVPTYFCAALARADGITTLLGGDGGDELFGGNERYARQYLYSLYGDLPAPFRKVLVEPVAALLPALGPIGKAKRYLHNATQPMPERYDNHNLLQRLGARTVFTAEFLEAVDLHSPLATLRRDYESVRARTLINRMLALDLKYTLADNDLPKVARACELAGVAPRFPMLNAALVAFSARLAPEYKLRGASLRWFFRKALSDYLPPQIIAKRKHGFGLPFGLWLQTHKGLRDLAFDSLAALKRRRIVRATFIDELMCTHLEAHAAYYGTLVWVFMMLEQWLYRQQRPLQQSDAPPHASGRCTAAHGEPTLHHA